MHSSLHFSKIIWHSLFGSVLDGHSAQFSCPVVAKVFNEHLAQVPATVREASGDARSVISPGTAVPQTVLAAQLVAVFTA